MSGLFNKIGFGSKSQDEHIGEEAVIRPDQIYLDRDGVRVFTQFGGLWECFLLSEIRILQDLGRMICLTTHEKTIICPSPEFPYKQLNTTHLIPISNSESIDPNAITKISGDEVTIGDKKMRCAKPYFQGLFDAYKALS